MGDRGFLCSSALLLAGCGDFFTKDTGGGGGGSVGSYIYVGTQSGIFSELFGIDYRDTGCALRFSVPTRHGGGQLACCDSEQYIPVCRGRRDRCLRP